MPKIKKLPPHEAQKIAAGEVIERPANVLKELLENAIDAGATKISIYLEDAGKELIRIVDNGCGMSPEDAELCFEQYATGKINCVEELQEITTFGFRGEALASIAAVAKVILVTKEPEAEEGTCIHIEQSVVVQKNPVPAVIGTDITVRDIFFNIPARRKFLKKRETEWHQMRHLFFAVSLAHLAIDFKLYNENMLIYSCSTTSSLSDRWQQLFNQEISDRMLSTEHRTSSCTVSGLISDHQVQRYDRSSIYLFVNKRYVHDVALTRAYIKGYQNVLQPGRFPTGCLFIEIDPKGVDVNIHPRKDEVRFMHPRTVERDIQACITKTLEARLTASLKKIPRRYDEPLSSFVSTQAGEHLTPPYAAPTSQTFFPYNFDAFLHPQTVNRDAGLLLQEKIFEQEQELPQIQQKFVPHQQYELIGQYKKTYLLLEQDEGLFMIDQHAAHERILYERYSAEHGNVSTVKLLFPQDLRIN